MLRRLRFGYNNSAGVEGADPSYVLTAHYLCNTRMVEFRSMYGKAPTPRRGFRDGQVWH